MPKLILFALSAAALLGQDVSRVFHFHHIDQPKDLDEFATLVRTMTDLPSLSADPAQKTLSATGTPAQIATAEWMFTELDRQSLPEFATKEFKVPNKEDDVVRVFFLRNAATVQDFQEVATTVRTVLEIRRVFTFNTPRALAVRGTADQIAGTEWMIRELDQPATAKRTDSPVHEIIDNASKHSETRVRVFYLPFASSVQQFQEAATLVRTIGDIRRVFTYNTPKAMVVRGDADQMALTDWMIHELAKPVTAETVASAPYTFPDSYHEGATCVRVFYVKDTPTVQAFQQLATQIRTTTQIRRVFTYDETRALVLRGTAAQLALAEQILHDRQIASNK
jgi:hypothetical protein